MKSNINGWPTESSFHRSQPPLNLGYMLRDINVYLKQVLSVTRPNSIKPVSFEIVFLGTPDELSYDIHISKSPRESAFQRSRPCLERSCLVGVIIASLHRMQSWCQTRLCQNNQLQNKIPGNIESITKRFTYQQKDTRLILPTRPTSPKSELCNKRYQYFHVTYDICQIADTNCENNWIRR